MLNPVINASCMATHACADTERCNTRIASRTGTEGAFGTPLVHAE